MKDAWAVFSKSLILCDSPWHLRSGDPTPVGWLITAGYLLTAGRAVFAARALRSSPEPALARPWWWVGGFAGALGINKQLDFQTLLIEWGRTISQVLGVSAYSRMIEKGFLVLLGLAGIPALLWWIRRYSSFVRNHHLLFTGALAVLLYAGLRAADTMHVEPGAASSDDSLWSGLLEISGVSLMVLGAGIQRKEPPAVMSA